MIKSTFTGTPNNNGKFIPEQWGLKDLFKKMAGIRLTITVEKYKKPRSNKQNSYMWSDAFYGLLADYTGYTKDEMHDSCRMECLRIHRDGMPDTIRSTTDLSTIEFEMYLEEIRVKAAEGFFGVPIVLPEPNECGFDYSIEDGNII